jgi:RHS repeat-associated protein
MANLNKYRSPLIGIICAGLSIFFVRSAFSQTPHAIPTAYPSGELINFVRTWSATAPYQNPDDLIIRPLTDVKQNTQYFDGFTRPMQSVAMKASPLGNDLVTTNWYDAVTGNQTYTYLPFISNVANTGDLTNDGNFKKDAFQQEVGFYNTYLAGQTGETTSSSTTPNWAYSKTNFESSPLDRPLSNFPPGVNWAGSENLTNHSVKQQLYTNTATDNVVMWTATTIKSASNQFSNSPTLPVYAGIYPVNSLFKASSTDEQGHQSIEFRDQYGQIILTKVQNASTAVDNGSGSAHTGWLCTYYVYDDYGNLRFIITPNVVQLIDGTWSNITQSYVDELCYYFEYDDQNRQVIKKTPGTPTGINGEIWMVYDQRSRLVMSQDGYQRSLKQWKYFQYDGIDRVSLSGLITDPSSNLTNYTDLTTHVNAAATSITYPNPASYTNETMTQSFYDNYKWMSAATSATLPSTIASGANGSGNACFTTTSLYPQLIKQSAMTHGMMMGAKTEVMGSAGAQYLYAVSFFDEKGRLIQTQAINFSGSTDISTNLYDWSGKELANLVAHTLSSAGNPQTHNVASVLAYDAVGRLLTITKTVNSTVGGVAVSASSLTVTNAYDEASNLKKKTYGNALEGLTYDYNVRGWLLGANRDFAKTALSTTNYFGFDLGYDQTAITPTGGSSIGSYATQSFNSEVAGTVWKSRSDGVIRKFDYTYDYNNRMLTAPYNESATVNTWSNATINFSVAGLSYDNNGNIGTMQQYGYQVGGSQIIDNLTYNYNIGKNTTLGANYSDRLLNVMDAAVNNSNSTLGDLHYPAGKTATNVDYGTYNANGNVTADYNRNISSISYYNDMNLPNTFTVTAKGTVKYTYDASGNKLQKQTIQNNATVAYNGTNYSTTITTTTKYIDGFIYRTVQYSNASLAPLNTANTDVLQFTGHEEGRIRFIPGSPAKFVFDYFLHDNLGNVRMVLTDEQTTDIYPAATMETTTKTVNGVTSTAQAFESQYYTVNTADVTPVSSLSWWSSISGIAALTNTNTTPPNTNDIYSNPGTSANSYKLNGATGDKTGLGITLKVMAGDQVNIYAKSVWHNTSAPVTYQYITASPLINFLTAFAASSAVTAATGGEASATALSGSTTVTTPLSSVLTNTPNQPSPTLAPKAAINWILFDDQFRATAVGTQLVNPSGNILQSMNLSATMIKSGYLYVYCSNESNIDVYFDNLQVTLGHSPMLEETHYYPSGLAMAGISDRAFGKTANYYHLEGNEIQKQEWNDGTGLEEYDFGARFYDQQTARWQTQDPDNQFANPYLAMGNSWPNGIDPDGRNFWSVLKEVGAVIGLGGVGYIGASLESHSWDIDKWNNNWWKGAIAADIIAAALVVGVAEVAAPATAAVGATATTAAVPASGILGLSFGASQVAIGAAVGVGSGIVSNEAMSVVGGKGLTWNWDQMFVSVVSGAITGALSSAPISDKIDETIYNSAAPLQGTNILKGLAAKVAGAVVTSGFKNCDAKGWSFGHFFDIDVQGPAVLGKIAGQGVSFEMSSFLKNDLHVFSAGLVGAVIKGYAGNISTTLIGNLFKPHTDWWKGILDYNLKQQLPGTIFGLLAAPYYGPPPKP